MAAHLARLKSLLLALCAASALVAQVDSKLLTTTDILDVYKSGGATPEMLTIFDMSGSMVNAFWSKDYWTDQNSDSGNTMFINSTTGNVYICLGGSLVATGFLVEPSGAKITTLPITAAVVKTASHARLTANLTSGTNTYTRTVDIPVPWTLFQQTSPLPAAGTAPVPDFFVDPTTAGGSGASVVFDTVYTTATNVLGATPGTRTITGVSWSNTTKLATFTSNGHGLAVGDVIAVSGVTPAAYNGTYLAVVSVPNGNTFTVTFATNPGTYSSGGTLTYYPQLGYFTYNADYIYWLFWGNVVKANDGNSYVVTAATGVNDDRNQGPPGGGLRTTSTGGLGGAYPIGGGYVIPGVYNPISGSSATPSTTAYADGRGTTFNNGIPPGTRSMYLKKAVLQTWLSKQDKVLWAYRFLGGDASQPSSNNFDAGNRYLTQLKSTTSGIHASVATIQSKFPTGGTPLTKALANAYAQLSETGSNTTAGANNGSVFDKVNTGKDISPCRSSYVIIFTDGLANTDTVGLKEVDGTTTPPTGVLGESVLASIPKSALNEGSTSTNFNIWSLAAVAAHGSDNGTNNSTQQTTGSGLPSAYAPFRVKGRGAEGTIGRRITTMTVGLSLAGTNTSSFTTGGKGPLLRTALYGDPTNMDRPLQPPAKFDLINSVAYGKTPKAATGIATNFFDASDPAELIASLAAIINAVTQANTSITAPAAPLVGLNLGNRAYLGRFSSTASADDSSSVWQGDLLMCGIGISASGTVELRDRYGNPQIDINAINAVASASGYFHDPTNPSTTRASWKNRNVYTMVPGTAIPSGGLPLTAGGQAFSTANGALTPTVMGVSSSAARDSLIRFIRGASATAQLDGTTLDNRQDIMGDIVNSSPAALEYDPGYVGTITGNPLSAVWSTYIGMKDPRMQVIFVGDNQGHFHAFGEVSALDATGQVLSATLVELWSFVPPELLNLPTTVGVVPKLSQLQTKGNSHIYTVDGSPYIYFNDAPELLKSVGNRKVDSLDPTVRVIFGMRKGGRSYYALDIKDPFNPKLVWMLDPNTSTDPAIRTMGLATSTPSVARVETGDKIAPVVQDLVFLGGGYSNKALDEPLSGGIGNNPGKAKLGRSLLVLNVDTGSVVKIYDFVTNGALAGTFPNMGAIGAGAFPLEFYVGSKKAQRVYFGDISGGVYALGSMEKLTTNPVGWRLDNSNIDYWTTNGLLNTSTTPGTAGIRWIYKGAITAAAGKFSAAAPVSGTPVAFRVPKAIPQFARPTGGNAPNMIPPVVGVAFGTGDRNDPMDLDPLGTVGSAPYRQVMVFDRQDSADLPSTYTNSDVNTYAGAITDAQLSDQTATAAVATAAVGPTGYLGNSKLGYYLTFQPPAIDSATGKLVAEKSYLNTLVLNGGLIFSTFKPVISGSGVICQGAGNTFTFRMCDALAPVFGNGQAASGTTSDKTLAGCNGWVFSWTNLAGDLAAIGSRMVLQSGQDTPVAGVPPASNVKLQNLVVNSGTTSFAPRAWRIIR